MATVTKRLSRITGPWRILSNTPFKSPFTVLDSNPSSLTQNASESVPHFPSNPHYAPHIQVIFVFLLFYYRRYISLAKRNVGQIDICSACLFFAALLHAYTYLHTMYILLHNNKNRKTANCIPSIIEQHQLCGEKCMAY